MNAHTFMNALSESQLYRFLSKGHIDHKRCICKKLFFKTYLYGVIHIPVHTEIIGIYNYLYHSPYFTLKRGFYQVKNMGRRGRYGLAGLLGDGYCGENV